MIGLKWKNLNDFTNYHHSIIRNAVHLSAPISHKIVVGDIACELWSGLRTSAGRSPISLCFDCCYLVLRLSGNQVSIIDMQDIALEVVKRPVSVWRAGKRGSWWKDRKCKEIILEVCGKGNPEAVLPLYNALHTGWGDDEE